MVGSGVGTVMQKEKLGSVALTEGVCDICHFLMFLQLPDRYSAPWRLVFSTQLHGESFTRMVAGLSKRGPTLLLMKDIQGHVFGGFASQDWEIKPQFQGEKRG